MIGYCIMMWFVSVVLFVIAISLLKGNHTGMHGKAFDITNDKTGLAKATGKIVLFICFIILISSIAALISDSIIDSLIILMLLIIAVPWGLAIHKKYKTIQ